MTAKQQSCLLLGKNHSQYGEVSYCHVGKNVACAITVGSDKKSPSLLFKGNDAELNEDAVLAVQHGNSLLLAIADAHFGLWASHSIISSLSKCADKITDLSSLYIVLQKLCDEQRDASKRSETTLAVLSLNLVTGEGFGISFGDSSVLIASPSKLRRLNSKNSVYVSLNTASLLNADIADEFKFRLVTGECLVVFTDGIDECHYGSPETSVTDEIIHELAMKSMCDVGTFIKELICTALKGVNGNPGGQDNIAMAGISF